VSVFVRALEAFFRHKWLIVLPPLLVPLVVVPLAILLSAARYEASAGVWVDRPTYLVNRDDLDRYATPSQLQASRLYELLQTNSFRSEVARQTSLAPLTATTRGEEELRRVLGRDFSVSTDGTHLVVLRFRASTPEQAHEVLRAVVETFRERATADRVEQAQLAISFYESRVQSAESQLDKTTDALRRYVATNMDPGRGADALTASRAGVPLTAADPQLAELQRRVEADQREVERTRSLLEQTRLDVAASIEGQERGFQVLDPPRVPTQASRGLRRTLLITFPASLLAGLLFSIGLLTVLVAIDRTVRGEADLAALGPAARVLGVVPALPGEPGAPAGPVDAVRRAIGYVAGAQPPAAPDPAQQSAG
jgi:uncharacterized protein involved in exopolysaccharide biosynthesis